MRQRRRHLVEQTDDLAEAIAVLAARANGPGEKTKVVNAAKARKEAKSSADVYVRSAAAVDRALVALEAAFLDMRTRGNELQTSLRRAGLSDKPSKPKRKRTEKAKDERRDAIGEAVATLLRDPRLSYADIRQMVLAAHPKASTSTRSIASVAAAMRRGGTSVPLRRSANPH